MSSCPGHETFVAAVNARPGSPLRAFVLDHASDCSLCRRHLEVLTLQMRSARRRRGILPALISAAAVVLIGLLAYSFFPRDRNLSEPIVEKPRNLPPARERDAEPRDPPRETTPSTAPAPEERAQPENPPSEPEVPRVETAQERPSETSPPSTERSEPAVPPAPQPETEVVKNPSGTNPVPEPKEDVHNPLTVTTPFGRLFLGKVPLESAAVVDPAVPVACGPVPSGFRIDRKTLLVLMPKTQLRIWLDGEDRLPGVELEKGGIALDVEAETVETPARRIRLRHKDLVFELETAGSAAAEVAARGGCVLHAVKGDAVCVLPGGTVHGIHEGEHLDLPSGKVSRGKASERAALARRYAHDPAPKPVLFTRFEAGDLGGLILECGRVETGRLVAQEGEIRFQLREPVSLDHPLVMRFRYRTPAARIAVSEVEGLPNPRATHTLKGGPGWILGTATFALSQDFTIERIRIEAPAGAELEVDDVELFQEIRGK